MKQKAAQKNDELFLNCPQQVEVYADKDRFPGKGATFTVTLYDKGYKEFIKD